MALASYYIPPTLSLVKSFRLWTRRQICGCNAAPTCVSAIQNERLFQCLHLTNLWWVWFWICEGQLDFLVKNILNFNNNGYLAQKSQRISFWFVVKVITKKKLNVNFSVWYFSIITWCFICWVLCITFTNASYCYIIFWQVWSFILRS